MPGVIWNSPVPGPEEGGWLYLPRGRALPCVTGAKQCAVVIQGGSAWL